MIHLYLPLTSYIAFKSSEKDVKFKYNQRKAILRCHLEFPKMFNGVRFVSIRFLEWIDDYGDYKKAKIKVYNQILGYVNPLPDVLEIALVLLCIK